MLVALAITGALLVPVALAFACGPQAQISADQSSYAPGEDGTISGVNFTPDANISIDLEGGATLASVVVPAGGSFSVAFTVPATAGTYVIVANGTDPQGNAIRSTPATITVRAPATAPAPGPGPAAAPSGAPAQQPSAAPAAPSPDTSAAPATRKKKKKPAAKSKPSSGAAAGPAPAAQPDTEAASVFTASTAGATTAAASRRSSSRAAQKTSKVPSESTAQASAWGGLGTSRDAALVPSGKYPATSGGSSAVTASLVLLALGLAALVGGVGISEVRKRRND